ncbi:hypothetical protein [Streptosporangium vulgare]|uniref:Uncharacterized protein n=1 Tax=Streptosporangium vulgare TaxID=46190 RepID=A0ABV5TT50_9ACTN
MSETTGVEREPLHTTIPAAVEQVTRWLVAGPDGPLAVRDTQPDAFRLCEDAERAQSDNPDDVEFFWYPADETDPTSPEELYVSTSGPSDAEDTQYTVTPLVIRIGGAQ